VNAPDAGVRARGTWASLLSRCVRGSASHPFVFDGPDGHRAPAWPYSQVLAAAVDMAQITGETVEAEGLLAGLAPYAAGDGYAPLPGQRRRFFDDNAWIGLALMQLFLQTGEAHHLSHARRIFGFVASGRDERGGVRWREGRRSRHTCSTAPAAQLALRLERAGSSDLRVLQDFTARSLSWLRSTMRLESGLFADHVDRWGRLDRTIWSYNQGSAVGAFALGSRNDGGAVAPGGAAFDEAMETAMASLAYFDDERTWHHPPVFNAVWFRNLLALDAVEKIPGLHEAFEAYLDRAWNTGRDDDGLFTAGGIGSYDGTATIDAAGLVQLYALRAWPRDRLHLIC
jgi:hypothetical protein